MAKLIFGAALGGLSWILLAFAMVLPQLLGERPDAVLQYTAALVGVQASQSSVIQVGLSKQPNWLRLLLLLFIAGASSSLCSVTSSPALQTILATIAGSAVGLEVGFAAAAVLGARGGVSFQKFQLLRSAVILAAAAGGALVHVHLLPFSGVTIALVSLLAFSAVAAQTYRSRSATSDTSTSAPYARGALGPLAMILLGFGASLFYRNDVNWLRASLIRDPDFEVWHYGLVTYAACQGVVGFVVVQLVLADRSRVSAVVDALSKRSRAMISLSWLVSSIVTLFFSVHVPVPVSLLLGAVLAAAVGLLSGVGHALGRNWGPYVAGVLATSVLLFQLEVGVDPRFVICCQSAIIGCLLLPVVLTRSRKAV